MDRTTVALVGNPNSGKSTLFNILTGLRQTVGNFPGVTVDKKIGVSILDDGTKIDIIDLPGLYSLYPNSSDEKIVVDILTDLDSKNYPDLIIYVADATSLERHILLASQILDLNVPMVFALNMMDIVERDQISIDVPAIQKFLGVPVVSVSGRDGTNVSVIKNYIAEFNNNGGDKFHRSSPVFPIPTQWQPMVEEIQATQHASSPYLAKLLAHHYSWLNHLSIAEKATIENIVSKHGFADVKNQISETMSRFNNFSPLLKKSISEKSTDEETWSEKVDNLITHRVAGPLIFFAILFLVFQAIYAWSELPMTWIEEFFVWSGESVRSMLPSGWISDLIVDGIIAGLGGVMVFIPQITILFLLIAIMEETGYMARAVFMFDEIMQKFGLNGRSIVALVSSGACAIPAIMSTRTISNWKERLNTIMVAPLISCSARIPVYTVLVGFVVPDGHTGWFNNKGLVFMGLYLLGIVAALGTAYVFKVIFKADQDSSLMIELPTYKPINWKNALLTVKEKVMTFIMEAGKVILLISIVLWFLASYGPGNEMQLAEESATQEAVAQQLGEEETADLIASKSIEASYAGHMGKWIEPVVKPLGFDWKIGIALITSFAAREVFVGTMATIYSVGSSDDEATVREKMRAEIRPDNGQPVYNRATALSLLVFYVFAMQCMSTLAITKRETKSWKWPIIQFLYMGGLAYLGSFITYQLLS